MSSKKIKFTAPKDYLKLKENYPKPIKFNIPDWYKKLEHKPTYQTVKGCMPFMESMTSGYVLELPQDLYIKHNVIENGKRITKLTPSLQHHGHLNLNSLSNQKFQTHPNEQVGKSPLNEKNLSFDIYKILNPWRIQTPKGYSCLFVPPLNNNDDRFSIIPAIVQTDTYEMEINFPFVINGDKYSVLDTIFKKGTPYVQIIPFKRDDWNMMIGTRNEEENKLINLKYELNVVHKYRKRYWKKINFK